MLLPILDEDLCNCLRDVLDPEIGVNIVDLGLVYAASRTANAVEIRLTLTSRACPLGDVVIDSATDAILARHPDLDNLDIQLVWDPPWSQDMITERGFELLGIPSRKVLD